MTSKKCKDIIASGWRASGITHATSLGTKNLPPVDPFHDNNPLHFEVKENNVLQRVYQMKRGELVIHLMNKATVFQNGRMMIAVL